MKGLIIGLAAGMAAGALISANFSEVRKLAKKAGEAVMPKKQQAGSGCECGEDCGCRGDAELEAEHAGSDRGCCECGEDCVHGECDDMR